MGPTTYEMSEMREIHTVISKYKPGTWQQYPAYEVFPEETLQQAQLLLYILFAQTALESAGRPETLKKNFSTSNKIK